MYLLPLQVIDTCNVVYSQNPLYFFFSKLNV